ncbi:MAG: hypothetical protein ACE5ER_09240, partial [Nitrospinaceae bacterium]
SSLDRAGRKGVAPHPPSLRAGFQQFRHAPGRRRQGSASPVRRLPEDTPETASGGAADTPKSTLPL